MSHEANTLPVEASKEPFVHIPRRGNNVALPVAFALAMVIVSYLVHPLFCGIGVFQRRELYLYSGRPGSLDST